MVDDVPEDALITHEESFGPLAAITVGDDDDDRIRLANIDDYGLQMALSHLPYATPPTAPCPPPAVNLRKSASKSRTHPIT